MLKLVQSNSIGSVSSVSMTNKNQQEERLKRSIILPERLWQVINDTADRTKRSANGVIEAVLSAALLHEDVELKLPQDSFPAVQSDKIKKAG